MRIQRISPIKDIEKQESVDLSQLDSLIEKYRTKKGNLIPLLQGAQEIYGFLPEDVLLN